MSRKLALRLAIILCTLVMPLLAIAPHAFAAYTCTGGGDHGGAAWDPATDCPGGVAGVHTNVGTLTIASGETAAVQAYSGGSFGSVSITAASASIVGTLTAVGKGYTGGTSGCPGTAGSGPGGGLGSCGWSGGGGYGGAGGTGSSAGGSTYGSMTAPVDLGSGGGGGNGSAGGIGGGAIRLNIAGTATVSGSILATGGSSPGGQGGGGSGGSIYLTSGSLAGAGSITANGGNDGSTNGGSGSGGRVAVYYASSNTFSGTLTANGGTTAHTGAPGTNILVNSGTNDLYVNTSQTWKADPSLEGSTFTYHSVTVQNSATLTLVGYETTNTDGVGQVFTVTDFTVATGAKVSADAGGYTGGTSGCPGTAGSGPGGGLGSCGWSGGGGYGGAGGTGSSAGGSTYGSMTAPVDLGSGGGGGNGAVGGAGGGAIKISASGTISIGGTVSANGGSTPGAQGGGGSGGSIYLVAGTLTGAGVLGVNGGLCGNGNGGSGGGGRIAIAYSVSNAWSGTTLDAAHAAAGGSCGHVGTAGTVSVVQNHTLTYAAGAHGTISGTTPQTVANGSSGSAVTAVPDTGYHFTQWSDSSVQNPRTDTNVTTDINVTASFAINTYTLTYNAGTGGSISGTTPQAVNYGADGTAVTAVPSTGYHFVDWSDSSTNNPRTDTNVTSDQTVTANFALDTHTLTYTAGANGSISGTTPQTVSYGSDGSSVTAVPNAGYHFVQWSDSATNNPRTDTNVTGDISVTATFAINQYALTYTAGANGSISGTTSQTVDYGSDGSAVTAVPDSGYHFVDWSDSSSANPRTDTNVMADVIVTAQFAASSYTVTFDPQGGSSVAPITQDYATTVTVPAGPTRAGHTFLSWNTAADGTGTAYNPSDTFTMPAGGRTLYAQWATDTRTLTYTAGAHGSISGTSPQTVNYGSNGSAVTAVPSTGYHFMQWSDSSTDNPRIDTNVTADITVTASFAVNTYTLTYTAGAHGSITGVSPQTVDYGTAGTAITAVPDGGYHFTKWSDGVTDNPRTDTGVTGDVTVVAQFTADSDGSSGSSAGGTPAAAGGTTTTSTPSSTPKTKPAYHAEPKKTSQPKPGAKPPVVTFQPAGHSPAPQQQSPLQAILQSPMLRLVSAISAGAAIGVGCLVVLFKFILPVRRRQP